MLGPLCAGSSVAASITAVALARRRADHRPFAIFVCAITLANLVRIAIGPWLAPRADPFTGELRALFHVEQALFLVWPAGIAAVTLALHARRHPWPVGLSWAALTGYLVTHYPAIRGDALRRVYLGAELAALAVAAASIVTWGWRKETPTPARVCALLVCLIDGGTLFFGAWRIGFYERWELNQAAYLLLWIAITAHQVFTWRSYSRSSSPPS